MVRLEIETGESLICLEESSGSVVCWYTLLENLGDQGHACPRWLGKSGVIKWTVSISMLFNFCKFPKVKKELHYAEVSEGKRERESE